MPLHDACKLAPRLIRSARRSRRALVEGRVRVHRSGRTLVELGPGATVGELAVLVPAPRTAWVTALEPTLVLRVDQAVLDDLLVDWPELAHGVIAALVSRLRATAEHAGQGAVSSTTPRGVVGLLTAQALAFGVTLALLTIPAQFALPRRLRLGVAAGDLHRDRDRRQRSVRARSPARPGERGCTSRHGEPRCPRRALRASWVILVAGGAWASAVLLVLFPIALQTRVRLHWRAGGPAARRAPDEGVVPPGGVGIRRGFLPRRRCSGSRCSRCSARPRTCCSQRPQRSSRSSGSCW